MLQNHQSELADMKHKGVNAPQTQTPKTFNVLDSKAIANMKTFKDDKSSFRAWHEKFVNVFSQVARGCSVVFDELSAHVDKESSADFDDEHDEMWFEERDLNRDKFEEDLYVVLIDKTEGEALTRVRAAAHGKGISAYMNLYKWFTGTTGMAVTECMRKIMTPITPKHESDIADAIDKWIESVRNLAAIKEEYNMQIPFRFVALEHIMNVGNARMFYENARMKINGNTAEEFNELMSKCRDYATKRRLDQT